MHVSLIITPKCILLAEDKKSVREHELTVLFIPVSFQLLSLRRTPPELCRWTPLGTPVSLADPVLPPPFLPLLNL